MPDPDPIRWGVKTRLLTAGKEVCLGTAKTSLIADLLLACSIGKSYDFVSIRIVPEFFGPEFDPKMRFGCTAYNLMHYLG